VYEILLSLHSIPEFCEYGNETSASVATRGLLTTVLLSEILKAAKNAPSFPPQNKLLICDQRIWLDHVPAVDNVAVH
jgi:hypothetical protein